ncbi:rhamnan synthesis F family protein [Phycicoccus ginsengisoli]
MERSGHGGSQGRVAVVAQYSTQPTVSRSLNELVRQLLGGGYRVVVVSASEFAGPLVWDDDVAAEITVLRKPNLGYDFGSWAVGLAWDEGISPQDAVILCNDSLVGPLWSLEGLLREFEATGSDVFGLTDTVQFRHHLQSYFLGFRRGVLAEPALRRFWDNIVHLQDKDHVIHRNELGLSAMLRKEGFSVTAAFPHQRTVSNGLNPTISGWRTLLELGFPFVKREVLRTPEVAPNGEQIPTYVLRRYGVDLEEWL